ncbi:hypothetical protein [Butyricicoccus pullicaecorum]|uniref:hypothetical protein n=1 Tax=Butyricicoccus pullicaecorum TaxID=501571 RepID=UPI0019D25C47|nr:hypothetical protein [Butyricicoccus pullicaecorum]
MAEPTTALRKNIPQEYFYNPQDYRKTPHWGIFYFRKVSDAAREDNSTRTLKNFICSCGHSHFMREFWIIEQ